MIWNFFRSHWVALCLAVLIGIITVLPQLLIIRALGTSWNGVYPEINDDERYYLARGQDVVDGHTHIAQPYLWEGKEQVALQFWVPDVLIAWSARITDVPLPVVFQIADVLLPAIIFLLLYALGYSVSRSKLLALTAAVVLHVGIYLSLFGRPISPQVTLPFLLLFLWSLVRLVRSPHPRWLEYVPLGVAFGLLFHVYTYYWTYAVVTIAAIGVLLLWMRAWLHVRALIIACMCAFVIAIPYLLQLVAANGYPEYAETLRRVGMITTHMPSGILVTSLSGVYALLWCVGVWQKIIPIDRVSAGWFAIVLSTGIVMNHHVITGQNLEFSSHYRWLGVIVFVFGILYLWSVCRTRFSQCARLTPLVAGVCIGVSLFNGVQLVYAQSQVTERIYAEQRFGNVLQWLRTETPKDSVVFADPELSSLIPAFTSNNVFYASPALLHYMSNEEVRTRFLAQRYFDVSLSDTAITEGERGIWGNYYVDRYGHATQQNILRRVLGLPELFVERYPTEDIKLLQQVWKEYKQQSFRDLIVPFRVDYIIWDTLRYSSWNIAGEGFTELVAIGDFRVYRMQP